MLACNLEDHVLSAKKETLVKIVEIEIRERMKTGVKDRNETVTLMCKGEGETLVQHQTGETRVCIHPGASKIREHQGKPGEAGTNQIGVETRSNADF